MLEVILHSCVELCFFIGFQAIKRNFEGELSAKPCEDRLNMTVRGLNNAAPSASQTIDFGSLNEENNCVAVASTDVRIVSSPGDHVTGSSKVRMNNVVDYTWEEKFYSGQLLAVHMSGKYLAYGIKAGGKTQSVIRVVNRETAKRTLIKGIEGTIEDLAFAFIADRAILASLDCAGTLLVHNIAEGATGDISCQLLLTTTTEQTVDSMNPKRVFWCPFIPDDFESTKVEDVDDGFLLAVTRGNKVELWNVGVVTKRCGPGPHSAKTVSDGYLEIEASTTVISDAAFSPDGTAIATASYDGRCKFYQVYMAGEGEPRLLHEWEPHDGDPVNTLFFLDDHVNTQSDVQFWKYAVTGAKDNCEIKLWSCETWECLQKISLTTRSSRHSRGWGKLKAAIDLSAGYILLSDMYLRLLYVLELQKDADNAVQPFVQTITEFKLPCPILSFGIVDAGLKNFTKNSGFGLDELCNGDSEDDQQSAVLVRMYLVQPKSLQECHIVFQTSNAVEVHHNMLHTVPIIPVAEVVELKKDVDEENNQTAPILMTPDAFHSPHQTPGGQAVPSSTPPPQAPEPQELPPPPVVNQPDSSFTPGGAFISGGSSPSREVQEILSSPCFYSKPTSTTCLQETGVQEVSDEKVKSLEANIISLKADVAGLIDLAAQQAQELKTLREEIKRTETIKINEAIDLAVTKAVTAALSSQQQLKISCSVDPDKVANRVSSSLNKDVTQALNRAVAHQFKEDVKPVLTHAVDQMKTMIHTEVSHKLNLTDQALKENLGKVLRSKNMVDTLCHSLNSTASSALEEVYKDSSTKVLLPMFEKAATSMFQQINHTFTEGLQECRKEMESYAMKSNERSNMEIAAVQNAAEHMGIVSKKFSAAVDKEIKRLTYSRLDETMAEMGRNLNKLSLNNGSIRSGSVTPAGHLVDSVVLQSQITQLISQGQVNVAFQQALSASDLNLVLYVCEKVGPQQVFNGSGGCLLQQHVLLSLIQQLSADMSHHTETNQKYLDEAIMCLDPSNNNTREYMPVVLNSLAKQLQHYIASNPGGRLTRRAKMLQMATQSLLNQQ
uniref:Enhancer of mRNA-decapping protein 4 n=1 Tax=Lygus hesperus TaxID=30085 RepID=A0A0A9WX41_LYGHE